MSGHGSLLVMIVGAAATLGAAQDAPPPTSQPASQPTSPPDAEAAAVGGIAASVAAAHNRQAWRARSAVQAQLTVEFGGEVMIDGVMTYEIGGGRTRLALEDGTALVFDGRSAWVSPATATFPRARFHLLTWPYFMAAPFKLDDPGTTLEPLGIEQLGGKVYRTSLLTFDHGTGDSPDDWYRLYTDLSTDTLRAMAYIVTYGSTADAAQADPHAITYHDFAILSGVVIPMRWRFWQWNEEDGLVGDETIGEARLRHIRFVEPDEQTFSKPADAREDRPPAP